MFKVTWINYGELDFESSNFCEIVYDVSSHNIFYETCNGIKHDLCCDFGSIFDELHNIVSSVEFQNEVPYEDGCDGDWYKFEYTLNGKVVKYEGYIYGFEQHEKVVSLIEDCAKSTLDEERRLLEHKCTDDEAQAITKQRQELDKDLLGLWRNVVSRTISIPDGFIECAKCKSLVHHEYYKNRKYWGREWLSGEFGEYEVEYDSGECPVCGELNTELPDTGIECQPDEDLVECPPDPDGFDSNKLYSADELDVFLKHLSDEDRIKVNGCQFKVFGSYLYDDSGDMYYGMIAYRGNNEVGRINMYYRSNATPYYEYTMVLNEDSDDFFQPIVDKYLGECQPDDPVDFDSGAVSITLFENKCTRFYSADELGYLLIHLSDEDRIKISDCQFKAFECGLDDDSGDIYYYLTVYRNTNEVGTIDIHYHSNTYWDWIDNELKTTNDIPSYTYTMTLNKDLEEGSKNPFDNTFDNIKSPFDNSRNPFDNSRNPFNNIKNPFSSSKFRCKKCGKIFCACNKSFSKGGK